MDDSHTYSIDYLMRSSDAHVAKSIVIFSPKIPISKPYA